MKRRSAQGADKRSPAGSSAGGAQELYPKNSLRDTLKNRFKAKTRERIHNNHTTTHSIDTTRTRTNYSNTSSRESNQNRNCYEVNNIRCPQAKQDINREEANDTTDNVTHDIIFKDHKSIFTTDDKVPQFPHYARHNGFTELPDSSYCVHTKNTYDTQREKTSGKKVDNKRMVETKAAGWRNFRKDLESIPAGEEHLGEKREELLEATKVITKPDGAVENMTTQQCIMTAFSAAGDQTHFQLNGLLSCYNKPRENQYGGQTGSVVIDEVKVETDSDQDSIPSIISVPEHPIDAIKTETEKGDKGVQTTTMTSETSKLAGWQDTNVKMPTASPEIIERLTAAYTGEDPPGQERVTM